MNDYAVAIVGSSWFEKIDHVSIRDCEDPLIAAFRVLQLLGYDIIPDEYGNGFVIHEDTTLLDLETYLYDEWDIAISVIKI